MPDTGAITLLLRDFAEGDKAAFDRLVPLVYEELRRIADNQLHHERPGHTLQPTALVHEAYARMVGQDQPDYRNRAHFLGIAARLMRRILIDHARMRNAAKRGGGQPNLPIDEARDACAQRPEAMIALDDALNALQDADAPKARLIEMRYFGGMSLEECAEALAISVSEVRREERVAEAWLQRQLGRTAPRRPVRA